MRIEQNLNVIKFTLKQDYEIRVSFLCCIATVWIYELLQEIVIAADWRCPKSDLVTSTFGSADVKSLSINLIPYGADQSTRENIT